MAYLPEYLHLSRIIKSANARRGMRNDLAASIAPKRINRTEVKQAITLMWICGLFVVCQSPKLIPDFYEALFCNYSSVSITVSYL